jgi:hypothetical protein
LRPFTRTSFHHQPEAQHPKSSAIHKPPADYPISGVKRTFANLPVSSPAMAAMPANLPGRVLINAQECSLSG